MNVDIVGLIQSAIGLAVGSHIIHYFLFRGRDEQWKKEIDKIVEDHEEKFKEMGASIAKLQEIHTLEKLNAQKLDALSKDFSEHKKTTEGQFDRLHGKIDTMVGKVIDTLGKLADK